MMKHQFTPNNNTMKTHSKINELNSPLTTLNDENSNLRECINLKVKTLGNYMRD